MTIDELRAKLNRYTETPESMHRLVLGLELSTTLIAVAPALFDIAEAARFAVDGGDPATLTLAESKAIRDALARLAEVKA